MLQKVEKLTEIEKTELSFAQEKANKANKELEGVRSKIAKAHNMEGQSWPEWRSWFQIDGDFILFYHQSHMELNQFIIGR